LKFYYKKKGKMRLRLIKFVMDMIQY